MSIHDKLNKLFEKYGYENVEEDLVPILKDKFRKEYDLAIKSSKKAAEDNPEMEMTPGKIADHISDNEQLFLDTVEGFFKK